MPAITHQILRVARDARCNVFIESGTCLGQSFQIALKSGIFERCYSVEIAVGLYKEIAIKYPTQPNQQIFLGKSHKIFKECVFPLCSPKDRIFFWLDGHFSGSATRTGRTRGRNSPCPLLIELETIRQHCPSSSLVIAIDDADDFGRQSSKVPGHNWPTRAEVDTAIYKINPNFVCVDYTGGGTLQKLHRGVLVFLY